MLPNPRRASFLAVCLLLLLPLIAACGATSEGAGAPEGAGGTAAERILVTATDLAAVLDDPRVRVVDFGGREEYAAGHIPGAVNLTWDQFTLTDTGEGSIAAWRGHVEQLLGAAGISPESRVVVYDHGTLYGARLWWVLDQLGHAEKQILDGGFAAWRQAEQPVSTEAASYAAATYSGNPRPELLATAAEVQAALGEPNVKLVDARSPEEYSGQNTSGAPRGGHIPGAVNVPFPTLAQSDEPRYYKSPDELRALYAGQGVTPDNQVIAYCTTGVRASVNYVSLRLAGFENVVVYPGSWAEWGARAELPVEK